ncbi:ribulose-bisphosphate carboxylase [Synergistales bacterium]|nr:ribulose-bisphosphate carboxylase [Synergistales bacterium]
MKRVFFEGYDDGRTRRLIGGGRFSVVYRLYGDEQTARGMAEDICTEQTVEFPVRLLPPGAIPQEIMGRVEDFRPEPESDGRYLATISFADETAAMELTQFLNVVFGNISIKRGIQVARIYPSDGIYSFLSGPRFGVSGLRGVVGVFDRPLLFTAIKPMGLSARDMAALASRFAEGGVDVIKDDHGLTNQTFAPFEERVCRCADAVREANAKFGRKAIYVPNVTAPATQIMARASHAKEMGAGGLLVTPGLVGLDAIRSLSGSDIGIPIFAHPAFIGSYALGKEGIACDALFGTLMRLSGADATIFPNYGGRFPLSKTECLAIADAAREKLGTLKPIFPAPAGGMELRNVREMTLSYGSDVLVLIGGGLFGIGQDIVANCRRFLDEVK